jgi:hypothetical protein
MRHRSNKLDVDMLKTLRTTTAAAVLALAPLAASAATINGAININGDINLAGSNFTALGGVDLVQGTGTVSSGVGDFAGLAGSNVTLTDILFGAPGNIWSVGGFTFAATSFLSINGGAFPNFTAVGLLSKAGFDDTQGTLLFSAQGNNVSASFSSTTTAVPVPAAGLMLLTALGAAAALRRKKA